MQRWLKNLISIILIVLFASGIVYMTLSSKETNNQGPMNGNMPNVEKTNDSQTGGEISDKPNETESGQNENGNGVNTPPAKPDGEDNNAPTPREGMNDMQANNNQISWRYYLVTGVCALGLSLTVFYLILSKFNKLSIASTFINGDKIIIYVLSSIILTIFITFLSAQFSSKSNNQGMPSTNTNITYSSKNEITENKDFTNEKFTSTQSDENAMLISGDVSVSAESITVTKTGDSNGGDNTSFYGNNSAVLAKDGANVLINNLEIKTDATGANGVFSYGGSATTNNSQTDGTSITINDSKITTSKDNSGGVMVTGGGTLYGNNLTVNTAGTSSAAIRSDRGGGTLIIKGGTYKTTGKGSPSIYSTASITVSDAKLISTASEGVVIEGKNSVTLNNVELIDTNNQLNGLSKTYKNIFIYQSMSGDASTGESNFSSTDSKITTNKGDTFYLTNTKATITLENNTFKNNDKTGCFLRAEGSSWGTSGSNGADITLNLKNQTVLGNFVLDSISSITINATKNSVIEGAINNENTAKNVTLKLDKTTKIKLTKDSYITSLDNEDTTNSNIDLNGYKLYVNGKSI